MGLDRMDNTQVAQDRALLKTAIKLRAPEKAGNLLTTWHHYLASQGEVNNKEYRKIWNSTIC